MSDKKVESNTVIDFFNKKYFGLPLYLAILCSAIVLLGMHLGRIQANLVGGLTIMFVIGLIFGEIGDRIPLWNTYIGGGIILTFLGTMVLVHYNILPEASLESIKYVDKSGFLNLFIIMLITGSLLGLNRDLMAKSFFRYIPAILGGVVGAAILGVLGGLVFGVKPGTIILNYVLPIMGGGNGGGAVPLSEMYERVTGNPKEGYYAMAVSILTIGNIVAIITAALLNKLGDMKPSLTGDKTNLMIGSEEIKTADETVELKMKDYGGAFILALSFFTLGRIFDKLWTTHISKDVPIHAFAWMIMFIAIANLTGIIPLSLRKAAQKLQSFFTNNMVLVVMVMVGASTSLNEILEALTISNAVIATLVVIGAIIGSAFIGRAVGLYPIDSAITAGLCMSNRGGSGDLAVLGAAQRMSLMSYAQLSSRLGGGIVLVIGSICFGLLY